MNGAEVARVIALLETTYGSKMAREQMPELQVEVWTTALAEIPWRPYGANAVDWWIRRESWPPTPADIRNRAKQEMEHDETSKAGLAMLSSYGILPGVTPASLENAEAVMEIVAAWEDGSLPLAGVRTACTGYDLFQTLIAVRKPDKKRVSRLCSALEYERVEAEGGVITAHGVFDAEDLAAGTARGLMQDGRRVIQFATHVRDGVPYYRPLPERRVSWEEG